MRCCARAAAAARRRVAGRVVMGLAGVALIGVVLVTAIVERGAREPFGDWSFSVAAWRTADEVGRGRMARDLIARHLAVGMTEAQVVGLLGKPDGVNRGDTFPYDRLRGVCFYVYRIGSWSARGMDDAFLYVHFDAAGRVMGAEIYEF